MENTPIKKDKEKGVGSWRWLLWWQISPEELEEQVKNYKTLKIIQSARGLSFLFCLASLILSLIMVSIDKTIGISFTNAFFEGLTMTVFGFFIYRGHRWASIIMMILWTLEKSIWVYDGILKSNSNATSIFLPIVWWCLYMHAFYLAFKVENLRRKLEKTEMK